MEIVESIPPQQRNRQRYPEVDSTYAAPGCAWIVGVPALLILVALVSASSWASHTLLAAIWPYAMGLFALILAPCVAVIGWRFYKVKKLHEYEEAQRRNEQKLLQEQVKLTRQTNQLVEESRSNGDNIKIQFGENGGLKSIEVVRAAVLLEQANQSRVRQFTEVKQQPIGGAHGSPPALSAPGRDVAQQSAGPLIVPSRRLVTPPAYDLIDVIRRFPLADDNMFLGIDGYKQQIACDPRVELCHGAFNAISGRGKTILVRGLETQILKIGFEVVHADIKFSLIDEKGNDYRPIARSLLAQGDLDVGGLMLPHLIMREEYIYHLIQWLAGPELKRRLAMYGAGDHSYSVFYLFLEELLYLISVYKDLGPMIGRLLNVGRSLGMKVFCVAQNFQVQNLKLNSGMRENFESAWFLGGDIRSAAALLDMSVKDLEMFLLENSIQLGKGVTLFRNNSVAYDPRLMRGGMASNDFVYWMLGKADNFKLPDGILPQLDIEVGGPKASKALESGTQSDERGGSQNGMNEPVETVGGAPDGRSLFPMMSEIQVAQFKALYPEIGSIDGCLDRIEGCNHRHRQHARMLIEQYGLKRRA